MIADYPSLRATIYFESKRTSMSGERNDMSKARARLFDAISAREDELVDLIQRLVRERSVLGNEAGAQRVVADYLRQSGYQPDVWDLPDSTLDLPGAGLSGVPFAGRPNVAASRPGAGGG